MKNRWWPWVDSPAYPMKGYRHGATDIKDRLPPSACWIGGKTFSYREALRLARLERKRREDRQRREED